MDNVLIDDVNYDQTKPHGSRRSNDAGENHWFDFVKKKSKYLFLYFTISLVYLLQRALQIAGSSFAEGFSERRLIAESSSHGSLSRRERGCHIIVNIPTPVKWMFLFRIYSMPIEQGTCWDFRAKPRSLFVISFVNVYYLLRSTLTVIFF